MTQSNCASLQDRPQELLLLAYFHICWAAPPTCRIMHGR